MTMPFAVRDKQEIAEDEGRRRGFFSAKCDLTICVDRPDKEDRSRAASSASDNERDHATAHTQVRLHEGDPMPPFTLINQYGQPSAWRALLAGLSC